MTTCTGPVFGSLHTQVGIVKDIIKLLWVPEAVANTQYQTSRLYFGLPQRV